MEDGANERMVLRWLSPLDWFRLDSDGDPEQKALQRVPSEVPRGCDEADSFCLLEFKAPGETGFLLPEDRFANADSGS